MKTPVRVCLMLLVGQSSAIINYYLDSYCYGYNLPIDLSILDSVRLRLTANDFYSNFMNCSVTLKTSSKQQLMYFFRSFDVESSELCQYDFLEMHDGPSLRSPYASGFYGKQCGSSISQFVYTTSNSALTLWFHSDNSHTGKGFDMIITSYHTGICDTTEYSCKNERCVDTHLTCNGFNPCGDHSDCALTVGAIAGIVVGCVAAIIIIVIVLVVVRRRRRHMSASLETHRAVHVVSSGYGYGQQYQAPPPAYPCGPAYPPPYRSEYLR